MRRAFFHALLSKEKQEGGHLARFFGTLLLRSCWRGGSGSRGHCYNLRPAIAYARAHLAVSCMQPHPPQLPTDAPASPAPKSLHRGVLLVVLVVAVLLALVAFLLPKKQVESNKAAVPTAQPQPRVQQAQADAYKSPTAQ